MAYTMRYVGYNQSSIRLSGASITAQLKTPSLANPQNYILRGAAISVGNITFSYRAVDVYQGDTQTVGGYKQTYYIGASAGGIASFPQQGYNFSSNGATLIMSQSSSTTLASIPSTINISFSVSGSRTLTDKASGHSVYADYSGHIHISSCQVVAQLYFQEKTSSSPSQSTGGYTYPWGDGQVHLPGSVDQNKIYIQPQVTINTITDNLTISGIHAVFSPGYVYGSTAQYNAAIQPVYFLKDSSQYTDTWRTPGDLFIGQGLTGTISNTSRLLYGWDFKWEQGEQFINAVDYPMFGKRWRCYVGVVIGGQFLLAPRQVDVPKCLYFGTQSPSFNGAGISFYTQAQTNNVVITNIPVPSTRHIGGSIYKQSICKNGQPISSRYITVEKYPSSQKYMQYVIQYDKEKHNYGDWGDLEDQFEFTVSYSDCQWINSRCVDCINSTYPITIKLGSSQSDYVYNNLSVVWPYKRANLAGKFLTSATALDRTTPKATLFRFAIIGSKAILNYKDQYSTNGVLYYKIQLNKQSLPEELRDKVYIKDNTSTTCDFMSNSNYIQVSIFANLQAYSSLTFSFHVKAYYNYPGKQISAYSSDDAYASQMFINRYLNIQVQPSVVGATLTFTQIHSSNNLSLDLSPGSPSNYYPAQLDRITNGYYSYKNVRLSKFILDNLGTLYCQADIVRNGQVLTTLNASDSVASISSRQLSGYSSVNVNGTVFRVYSVSTSISSASSRSAYYIGDIQQLPSVSYDELTINLRYVQQDANHHTVGYCEFIGLPFDIKYSSRMSSAFIYQTSQDGLSGSWRQCKVFTAYDNNSDSQELSWLNSEMYVQYPLMNQ